MVAYVCMHHVCKVNRRCFFRQGYRVPFWREHKYFVFEEVDFQGFNELLRIFCFSPVKNLLEPAYCTVKFFVSFCFLVSPVGSYSFFCDVVHFACPYLYLHGPVSEHYLCVQRLVKVWLWRCYVVIKPVYYGCPC